MFNSCTNQTEMSVSAAFKSIAFMATAGLPGALAAFAISGNAGFIGLAAAYATVLGSFANLFVGDLRGWNENLAPLVARNVVAGAIVGGLVAQGLDMATRALPNP